MKAQDVLRRYAKGERDFSGENLQGQSFKGKNLSEAKFRKADIRGTDFSNATLKSTDFSGVRAGLKDSQAIFLLLFSFWITSFLGITAGVGGFAAASFLVLDNVQPYLAPSLITLIALSVLFIFILKQGYNKAKEAWKPQPNTQEFMFLTFLILVSGVVVFVLSLIFVLQNNYTLAVVLVIFSVLCLLVSVFLAVGLAGVGEIAYFLGLAIAIEGVVAVVSAIAVVALRQGFLKPSLAISIVVCVAVLMGLISNYFALKIRNQYHLFSDIRMIIVNFASLGGTSFRGADLTQANFSSASLPSTDFREANLTHTCFRDAQNLHQSRQENPNYSMLSNPRLRNLLVHENNAREPSNYDGVNLSGAYLKDAKLADASFIGANLNSAYLQDADLSRAKLKQTQLDGADLTGATLTGAYIEDWGITAETKLDGVSCEYVYMRLPTEEDPEPIRKPDNRNEFFKDKDFADFIKPIVDTLDLYHNQGVDPRAIAISYKQLVENHPDSELEIVATEKRGRDKFLLRVKTHPKANKSELSAEYFESYNHLKGLAPEQQRQYFITELKIKEQQISLQESQIFRLENMIETALNRPLIQTKRFYSEGGIMPQDARKVSKFNLQNAQFAGGLVDAETVHAQQLGGNINNYASKPEKNLVEAAQEIQQLLQHLEQTYPTNTPLEKQMVVTEALRQIENSPTLKARVIGALKASGTEAFKELVDNPLVNILLAALEGWQEP